jgi:hypothetical protein
VAIPPVEENWSACAVADEEIQIAQFKILTQALHKTYSALFRVEQSLLSARKITVWSLTNRRE